MPTRPRRPLAAAALATAALMLAAPTAHATTTPSARFGATIAPNRALGLSSGVGAARVAPGWEPDVAAARAWAAGRAGTVAFAVRTPGRLYAVDGDRAFPSASVLKAMLLVAYLRRGAVRDRPLRAADRALLDPMIRRSDNATATRVFGIVGPGGLRRLARVAGMRAFRPASPVWGRSQITARDQTRYFLAIDALMPARHRAYGMRLLRTIVPSQRWGIPTVVPGGWTTWFKSGWGSGTGAVDTQVALLTAPDGTRLALAVLTVANPSHAYGKATEAGVARRLLRGLPAQR